MNTTMATTRLEAALEQQLLVAGGEPEVEAAAQALLAALGPAVSQLALDLAEQAATEVSSQLPGHEVEVVLTEGEPTLRVRSSAEEAADFGGESFDARITLRLPPALKELVESAADSTGESVNSWLVKTLQSRASERTRGSGRRVTGTIET